MKKEVSMDKCSVCGNHYQHCFEVRQGEARYVFDCFECAIHQLAPTCQHCSCRIIGHGIEANGHYYCCAHCSREAGYPEAKDHL